ncbi:DUF2092 domain-containing protein [Xenococcus sp. PCC 7305]|uniref:DUF2092 domain-containing protein n=1 Tax=Xenococcus sp. PCC 7305 TaxID=102125 RepID=UPI000309BD0E|nr:DUF2092 domain-containing protein [Xenococcus sp. PCC 7305]
MAALMTGLLLAPQLATFADTPTTQERTSSLIAQNDDTSVNEAIDDKANEILLEMAEFIKSKDKFSFFAESQRDILTLNGVYIKVHHEGSTIVNRPNQFWANVTGDLVERELMYDGSQITVVDTEKNIYAQGEAPSIIDETLDALIEKFNVNLPLAELLYSDIYEGITEDVQAGFYFGLSEVDDIPCHHLVFTQEDIDWQIWVEDSDTPVLRKVAIAYKKQEGVPRYSAVLSDWDLEIEIAADQFTFTPPDGATRVEFIQAAPY